MYKIIVKGEAKTRYPNLQELDGIDCQDKFSDYFDDKRCGSFKGDVTNGYMRFEFSNGKLWTITEYLSKRELSEQELDTLKDYTIGQWSDGIGEGFEQQPCMEGNEEYDVNEDGEMGTEVYISPWSREQVTTIEQITQ